MKYTERLGEISDGQLQKALDRFGLGKFVEAKPITQGLFGQNLFLTSTKDEFVFRGAPHYSWQFKNEKFFAELLNKNTSAPVPWPYLLDEKTDIFGWSYVIMPKLKGIQLIDTELGNFKEDDLKEIAKAQGEMLAEMQKLTLEDAGKYDEEIDAIKPLEKPFFARFENETFEYLEKAEKYNDKTIGSDLNWAKAQFEKAKPYLKEEFIPCFVMQDYKPGNMIVDIVGGRWQVTGIFDLMESYFGHGEADLPRMFCDYTELGRKNLANIFVNSYLQVKENTKGFRERFPVFLIHDRAIIWEWVQRNDKAWWDRSFNFRQWVETFLKKF